MTDDYDHEGTLREISISSADDEDMRAAEWALEEIERLVSLLNTREAELDHAAYKHAEAADEIERLRAEVMQLILMTTSHEDSYIREQFCGLAEQFRKTLG